MRGPISGLLRLLKLGLVLDLQNVEYAAAVKAPMEVAKTERLTPRLNIVWALEGDFVGRERKGIRSLYLTFCPLVFRSFAICGIEG